MSWLSVRPRTSLVLLLAASLASGASFPNENERLIAASRLWVTVSFFNASVASGNVDWDGAFLSAIPKIRSASTLNEYSAAITSMLGVLPQKTAVPQRSVMRTAFETAFVTRPGGGTETITLDLGGVKVQVRLSDPDSFQAAIKSSAAEASDPYPSTEARILAAAKTWGTIHYFFAYRDLMDEDWDEIFAASLPKFIAAKDAREYNLTLSEMLTHLTDSNVQPHSKTLDAFFGEATVGLRLRMLDKHPVIVSVLDPAASEAGVKPGDLLKRVDGESIVDRFNNQVQYVPASTPQRSSFDTLQRIWNGHDGSEVTLGLESPDGEPKTVTLVRTNTFEFKAQRDSEPVRLLTGNIGYLDLDRLTTESAEAAIRQFQDAKGIIFDLRGKAPAAAVIAAHLELQADMPAAIVTTPLALHPDVMTDGIATQTASTFLVRTLRAPLSPRFKGKTVALIDERTIGESEQAGLLFEAANKTEFIGVPSAGADTEIATFTLPGGITVAYSARDIRHANGGKLQRLGLQTVESAPDSPKTLRDGKDAALEAALAYLAR